MQIGLLPRQNSYIDGLPLQHHHQCVPYKIRVFSCPVPAVSNFSSRLIYLFIAVQLLYQLLLLLSKFVICVPGAGLA